MHILPNDFRPMRRKAIPDEEKFLALKVHLQFFQKSENVFRFHASGEYAQEEARIATGWRHNNDAGRGKILP